MVYPYNIVCICLHFTNVLKMLRYSFLEYLLCSLYTKWESSSSSDQGVKAYLEALSLLVLVVVKKLVTDFLYQGFVANTHNLG